MTGIWQRLLVTTGAFVLSGCAIAAKVDARRDLQQSKIAYEGCLRQQSQDVSPCEGLRLAYDTDLKTYRALAAGAQPGFNNTLNVNTSTE